MASTIDPDTAREMTHQLIAAEIAIQHDRFGDSMAKRSRGELLEAALAHITYIDEKTANPKLDPARLRELIVEHFYPKDWAPSTFRDYGSTVAQLTVAAAFLENEIVRLISNGESTYRAPRS